MFVGLWVKVPNLITLDNLLWDDPYLWHFMVHLKQPQISTIRSYKLVASKSNNNGHVSHIFG